jgi:hypothetical protein
MRWLMRAHRPSVWRALWRSRPSWFFSVQMIASMRWRSQPGKGRGACRLVFAGRPDQEMAQIGGGLLDAGSGESLVAHDRAWPAGYLMDVQQVQGLLAFRELFGVGQAEGGHRAVSGGDQHQLGTPGEGVVGLVHAVSGDLTQV